MDGLLAHHNERVTLAHFPATTLNAFRCVPIVDHRQREYPKENWCQKIDRLLCRGEGGEQRGGGTERKLGNNLNQCTRVRMCSHFTAKKRIIINEGIFAQEWMSWNTFTYIYISTIMVYAIIVCFFFLICNFYLLSVFFFLLIN